MLAHERCLSSRIAGSARPETFPDATSAKDAVTASAATNDIAREFQCLLQDGVRICAIERDKLKLHVRHGFIFLFVTALMLSLACAALMTSAAFILFGIAQGLADVFGGKPWLGYLVTGALSVLVISAMLALAIAWWNRSAFRRTRRQYEGTAVCASNADSEREFLNAGATIAREEFRKQTSAVKSAVVNTALAHPIATAAIAGGAGVFVAQKIRSQQTATANNDSIPIQTTQQHLPIATLIEILTKVLGA